MAQTTGTAKRAAAPKKAPVKKAAPARKAVAKKTVAKKTAAKKIVATKAVPPKKAPAKKAAAKRAAPATRTQPLKPSRATEIWHLGRDLPELAPAPAPTPARNWTRLAMAGGAVVAAIAVIGGALMLTADKPPSLKAYLAKADEVCRPANAPITAIVKPTNYTELAAAAGTVAKTTEAQLVQLRAMRKPSGADGRSVMNALDAIGAGSASAKGLEDAATRKDDVATVASTKDIKNRFEQVGVQAKAVGFTACGGGLQPGIDNVSGGAQTVLKAAFTAKAEGICRAGARKFEGLSEPNYYDIAAVSRFFGQAFDINNGMLNELKAIPVPPGDEAAVSAMVANAEKLNAKTAEMRDTAAADDADRFIAAGKEMPALGTAADASFDGYGLSVCGSNFGD